MNEVELTVCVDARPSLTRDDVSVICWADGAPLEQVLEGARRCRLSAGALLAPLAPVDRTSSVEVWYGACRIARCDVPRRGWRRLRIGQHAGPHLSPACFSARRCAGALAGGRARVAVIVAARAATEVETLAGSLLPPLGPLGDPGPSAAELLELRQALFA